MTYKQFVLTCFEALNIAQSIHTGYGFIKSERNDATHENDEIIVPLKNVFSLFESLPQ